MKNGLILAIADQVRDALPVPVDQFRKRLDEECFIIWKLPHFRTEILTETPVLPSYANYVESKNADLHGAYCGKALIPRVIISPAIPRPTRTAIVFLKKFINPDVQS